MLALYCSRHHVPRGDAITVVNLVQRDPSIGQHLLHCGRVSYGRAGVCIQGLDQDAHTPGRDSGPHKLMRVIEAQQSGLDPNSSCVEKAAQFDDPFFSLIGGD